MAKLNSFQLEQINLVDIMRERMILEVNEQSERLINFIKKNHSFTKRTRYSGWTCFKCYIRELYTNLLIPTDTVVDKWCDLCLEIVKRDGFYLKNAKYITEKVAKEAMLNTHGYIEKDIPSDIRYSGDVYWRHQYQIPKYEYKQYLEEVKNYKYKYEFLIPPAK